MALHYSKYFNIAHNEFERLGVYDGYLDKDSLLHIDPLNLKNCKEPEFEDAYEKFMQFFRSFVPLVNHAKSENLKDIFFKRIVKRYTMKEIPNTGLGFSKTNTSGKGISGALAVQLASSTYAIIKAGMMDPEIFGLMQLIEDNIAADRISDMTLSILQKDFLCYTERIAKELQLPTHPFKYDYDTVFNVPFYNSKPIHFVPMCILSELPMAEDYEDIDSVVNYNHQLKKKIAAIIGVVWSDYKKYKKEDWKKLILGNKKCYDTAVEYYRNLSGVPYDFNTDSQFQYFDVRIEDIVKNNLLQIPEKENQSPKEEVYSMALAICKQFKHLVEHNRLSEMFYRKKRMPDETDWQFLFYTIADTYKVSQNLDVSITREDNPGVGEIDFHFTRGSKANTVIEIKRSGNVDLLHGYRTQLSAYMKAERADSGIFIVVLDKDNLEYVKDKLTEVQKDMKGNNEYIPEVIYVNGLRQPSASVNSYQDPTI